MTKDKHPDPTTGATLEFFDDYKIDDCADPSHVELFFEWERYGWGRLLVIVGDEADCFKVSHVYGEPTWDLIELCEAVVKNLDSGRINLPDEDGNTIVAFTKNPREEKQLRVTIHSDKDRYDEDKIPDYEPNLVFEMSYQEFGDHLYHILDRLHSLFRIASFRGGRGAFPLKEFLELRRLWLAREIEDYPKGYPCDGE